MLTMNINDFVKVKLTPHGRASLHQQSVALERAYGAPLITPEEDAEGYSTWQLWELMMRFGHEWGNGLPVPFENTIVILGPNKLANK